MSYFSATLASLAADGEDYGIGAPENWAQGRTLFGGMTAALAYSAIGRALADLAPLRSAQLTFVGPATGSLRFRPTVLRRGRSATVASADCWNEDGLAARATFTFGGDRESEIAHDFVPRRDVPPPEDCAPFHRTSKPLMGFLGQFEFRLASGTRLFTPGAPPEFAVWTRLRDGDGDDPVAALLAYGDALPGAAMANFSKPAPISTMSWGIDLLQPLPPGGGWHLVCSSSEAAANGYSLQAMRVYNRAGEPLAISRQLVAIFL